MKIRNLAASLRPVSLTMGDSGGFIHSLTITTVSSTLFPSKKRKPGLDLDWSHLWNRTLDNIYILCPILALKLGELIWERIHSL